MADVFLSYKRDERAAIEQIASRLRALGLTVWFDASMSAGETFNAEIDREARAAKAILVCWSPAARQSEWVNAEAMIGFEQKKLAACYVAGPDGFSAPTPFNATHAEDLRAWLAALTETHAGWKSVLRRIGKLCGRADIETWGALDARANAAELRIWIAAHEASPLFMTVDALLRTREGEDAERARLEQGARERRTMEEAERRAVEEAARRVQEETERQAEIEREARARRVAQELLASGEANRRLSAQAVGWIINGAYVAIATAVALLIVIVVASFFHAPPNITETSVEATTGSVPTQTSAVAAPPRSAAWRAGQEFDDCLGADWCPRMVVLSAGTFSMGSPADEGMRGANEGPQHSVSIRRFAAGKYEVTFDQWEACSSRGGCGDMPEPSDGGWGRGNRPVINVSWNDAQRYVRWLSRQTHQSYRLLTEAEWEYAARAGTTTPYWTGSSITTAQANFDGTQTRLVGSYAPNRFGLYDMAGNVAEWVEDCYAASYSGLLADGSAHEEGSCLTRVVRSASWLTPIWSQRSAFRGEGAPSVSNTFLGFRVARALD